MAERLKLEEGAHVKMEQSEDEDYTPSNSEASNASDKPQPKDNKRRISRKQKQQERD